MPTATAEQPSKLRFKMRLKSGTYHADMGGRLPAGAVLVVDEDTAIRWLEMGVAEQAPPDAPTFRQQQRAEIAARLVPLPEGVYDEAITSESFGPTPTSARPRRMSKAQGRRVLDPRLAGSGVINNLTDTPDDDDEGESE